MKTHYIGYWNNDKNSYPEFPLPIPQKKIDNSKQVEMIQTIFENSQPLYCKVSSTCRCCGKMNGSAEYKYIIKNTAYVIPEGYLHYIKDHFVEVDSQIEELFNIISSRNKVFKNR